MPKELGQELDDIPLGDIDNTTHKKGMRPEGLLEDKNKDDDHGVRLASIGTMVRETSFL